MQMFVSPYLYVFLFFFSFGSSPSACSVLFCFVFVLSSYFFFRCLFSFKRKKEHGFEWDEIGDSPEGVVGWEIKIRMGV